MEQKPSENVIDEKKDSFKILGIGSSLNKKSTSTRILQITLEKSRKYGATVSLLNLREFNLPIFNPNKPRETTHDIIKINEEVNESDAFILATPDYHGSMSGGMKNFLDYYWYEFSGKLFGYIVSSHEKGLTVIDHMRTAVRQCYGWSLPYGLSINSENDFDIDGNIKNVYLNQRINNMARDMVTYGKLLSKQFLYDVNTKQENTFASQFVKK
ncbi:MAG: NAD(P)H-dependent oxidoreductase [Nitrososphaeraceae archaeon]|nr:NAD(P)H-dependent oxidoreductase [Nitrososphaeraceae archaeon]